MSSETYIVIQEVPIEQLDDRELERYPDLIKQGDKTYSVVWSRNGRVMLWLEQIIDLMPFAGDLYLLKESCILTGQSLLRSSEILEAVLHEMKRNPTVVCMATRDKHVAETTVHAQGLEPLDATVIYGSTVRIDEGWVYYFSEAEVLSLLSKASATDPEASRGDEGESLEYAFALLKSHLAIIQGAIASKSAVVFNRFN